MKTKLHFFFIFLFISINFIVAQTPKAKYSINFTSVWNSTDHGTLPNNAHWSRLVGTTHKTVNAFWNAGNLATIGVKNIAETGNNTVFNTEVTTAITNNESDQYINGSSLGAATGSIIINDLIVDKNYPLLTLLSMIAPSPDWFIGINSINLLDTSSNWKSSISLDLFAYDSGTDSGTNYSSGNAITTPFQNIFSLKNVAPFNDKKIGTLTITLTETLDLEKFIADNSIAIYYNKNSKSIEIDDQKKRVNSIDIYSIHGKLITQNFVNNSNQINLNSFSDGIYILKIVTKTGRYSKKIVKY
jgi:hypothetical protein